MNLLRNVSVLINFLYARSPGRIGDIPVSNRWLAWKKGTRFCRAIAYCYDEIESCVLELFPRFAARPSRVDMKMIPQELQHKGIDRSRRLATGAVGFESIPGDLCYEIFGKYDEVVF